MNRCLLLAIVGFLTIAVASPGTGRGEPQAQQQTQSTSQDRPQGNKPVVPKGCESKKMRCLTNDVRWQAAIKAADRRAANLRKHGGK